MEYQIALSPDLGLDADEFAATWNSTPEARSVAEARVEPQPGTQYDPILGGAVAVLGGIALGVVSNAVYDLIKQVLARRGVTSRTEIMQVDNPDGSRLLVITIHHG